MAHLKNGQIFGKPKEIHHFTGEVVSERKMLKSETTGQTSAYNRSSSVQTKITEQDEFILKDAEGNEKGFKFENLGLMTRVGAVMSVVFARKPGAERGPYILVINHNTDDVYTIKKFKSVCGPTFLFPLGISLAIMFLAGNAWGFFPMVLTTVVLGAITFSVWDGVRKRRCKSYIRSREFQDIQAELKALGQV